MLPPEHRSYPTTPCAALVCTLAPTASTALAWAATRSVHVQWPQVLLFRRGWSLHGPWACCWRCAPVTRRPRLAACSQHLVAYSVRPCRCMAPSASPALKSGSGNVQHVGGWLCSHFWHGSCCHVPRVCVCVCLGLHLLSIACVCVSIPCAQPRHPMLLSQQPCAGTSAACRVFVVDWVMCFSVLRSTGHCHQVAAAAMTRLGLLQGSGP
jgi:hypothetical protein